MLTRALLGVLMLSSLLGCSGPDASYAVQGQVTIDGKPVADGLIRLRSQSETTNIVSTEIVNGNYSFPKTHGVTAGEYSVEILAYRKSTKQINPPAYLAAEHMSQASEQFVPRKYNAESKLKVEITPDSTNTHNFALDLAAQ